MSNYKTSSCTHRWISLLLNPLTVLEKSHYSYPATVLALQLAWTEILNVTHWNRLLLLWCYGNKLDPETRTSTGETSRIWHGIILVHLWDSAEEEGDSFVNLSGNSNTTTSINEYSTQWTAAHLICRLFVMLELPAHNDLTTIIEDRQLQHWQTVYSFDIHTRI